MPKSRTTVVEAPAAAPGLRRGIALTILAAIVITSLGLAITSMLHDSATADEPAHIAAGVLKLRKGWLHFYGEQSLLPDVIIGVPLVLAGYEYSPIYDELDPWQIGRRLLYDAGYDAQRMLTVARIPAVLAFAGTLLLIYAFVARESGRREWALVATALAAFGPTFMAHGRLATADMTPTFFCFAATMLFFRLVERPTIPRGLAFGAVTTLAVLAKMSSLSLGPFFVLLLFFLRKRIAWRPMLVALGCGMVLAAVMLELLYTPLAGPDFLATLDNPSRAFIGFRTFFKQFGAINFYYSGEHGHPQFLLGEFRTTSGWAYYYLVALFLKTPIPAQLLVLFAVWTAIRGDRTKRTNRTHGTDGGTERTPLTALRAMLLFVAVFLAAASSSNIALGVRYVLLIFPFAFAAVGLALAQSGLTLQSLAKRRGLAVLLSLLVAWHIAENVRTYPSYISYFNNFIDDRQKDHLLIDSNLDWGQDLRRLRYWMDENQVRDLRVHYFGGGEPAAELGPNAEIWIGPNLPPLPPGYFAVSRHLKRITDLRSLSPVGYDEYLRRSRARFVTTIGGSIDIYRVD
ncbi:MAG TPA: glycosyltransferase family 39 protein [Thermoanaerobaculia bacterium]